MLGAYLFMIMINEEIKNKLEILKNNLFENYAVYHERVTLLVQLTAFEIAETGVNFRAKVIKPLDKSQAETNNLYKTMIAKDNISFSASYLIGQDTNTSILKENKLARPYCPFILWLDPELTRFVTDNEDEITKKIPNYILCNEDWKVLKN